MDRKLRVASTIGAALALAGVLVAPVAATYPGDVGPPRVRDDRVPTATTTSTRHCPTATTCAV